MYNFSDYFHAVVKYSKGEGGKIASTDRQMGGHDDSNAPPHNFVCGGIKSCYLDTV